MDVLTFETCWALNNEIKKQVTWSWSLFIQLSIWCTVQWTWGSLLYTRDLAIVPILSQICPVHVLPFYFLKIYFNILSSMPSSSKWSRPSTTVIVEWLCMEQSWIVTDGVNRSTRRKLFATSSTTNSHVGWLVIEPGPPRSDAGN